MAEKKPPVEQETESPEGGPIPIPMPVSDVAEWDDDERLKRYGGVPWPMTGRKEEEVLKAAKKLPDPKSE